MIEWYKVDAGWHSGSEFTFEAILWENGNVTFQYQTMNPVGGRGCEMIALEDSTGLDGLVYKPWCTTLPATGTAVRFNRPPSQARIGAAPQYQGRFAKVGETVLFPVLVRNTGDLGADTLKLVTSGPDQVTLFAADGVTPLTDTDGDGNIDTGLLLPGAGITVTARMRMSDVLTFTRPADDLLTVTSSRDGSKSKAVHIQAAVPASFAQVYWDYNATPTLALFQPGLQQASKPSTSTSMAYEPSITQAPNGNFVYVWNTYDCLGSCSPQGYNLRVTILDETGAIVRPMSYLTNNQGATMQISDRPADVAVTPDGHIGIIWYRERYDSTTYNRNGNIYFSVLDGAGNVVLPATNLTNNDAWSAEWEPLDVPEYSYPRLAATGDNHFVVSWRRSLRTAPGVNKDIFFAVHESAGAVLKPVTKLTDSYTGGMGFGSFTLAPLSGNRALFAADNQGIVTFVIDSQGNVTKGLTRISAPGDYNGSLPDAAQMANGNIAVAWTRSLRILYTILDGTATQIGSPVTLSNPAAPNGDDFVSVSASGDNAVLTWGDADWTYRRNLYYALVDSGGALIAAPMIFHSDPSTLNYFSFSKEGHGNAPYAPATRFALGPQITGSFAAPGSNVDASLQVSNLSNISTAGVPLRTDTFDMSTAYVTWPVAFYAADGITPLTDSNGNGQPDTGPVKEGETVSVTIRLRAPTDAHVGDHSGSQVTFTSSTDTGKQKWAILQSAIPAPFAQAYNNGADNTLGTLLAQPGGWAAKAFSSAASTYYHAVSEAPNGDLVRTWSRSRATGVQLYEVEYAITNRFGEVVKAPTRLTDESAATYNTYDLLPVAAVAPNGSHRSSLVPLPDAQRR